MVDSSPSPVVQTRAPSVLAIGCGGVILLMAVMLLVAFVAIRSILSDVGIGGGEHHWWPWDHHDRPEPWDPHDDHHHGHDDHHHRHRERSERVEEFLDNYANNLGAVYIEADRKREKGEKLDHAWFDRLFLKAHERAAASIKKEIEDTGEGPNYLELGHEFQGKED